MSFVNTLLQDITVFNGNDSSQVEDWLIDIKTASISASKIKRFDTNTNISGNKFR